MTIQQRLILLVICLMGFEQGYSSDFYLIDKNRQLNIYIQNSEKTVVRTATDMFCDDINNVSGKKTSIVDNYDNADVIIGTLGINAEWDKFLSSKGVPIKNIQGVWEAFRIQIVDNKGKKCLVVTGSDARGTAFGVLELSRIIGVSPWNWWADVYPMKKEQVGLPLNYVNEQQPSVQYRGIFINDEDWGLVPWSSQTFEKNPNASIGNKTYEKVFQLLLRLRANTLWPAMHKCSTPFYFVDGAKETADKYGIVIGTSHCEPLMRNNNGEWNKEKRGDYNFKTNKNNVINYWSERLSDVNRYENLYTVGMRGIHDGKMEGAETLNEQVGLLTDALSAQRNLLEKYIKKKSSDIPQMFMPYKEVLDVYDAGLDLADDITLVWCDDNFGYITRLSNETEQKRMGTSGVYYHISYFGRPHDYLWLYGTQPALIYTEMKKAWNSGASKLWMLNVGDIKPMEYGIEFFLDMAWNTDVVSDTTINTHLKRWLKREFGDKAAQDLAPAIEEYYRLSSIRRPEFMGWNRVEEYKLTTRRGGVMPVNNTAFNPFMFGDEIENRIRDFSSIRRAVEKWSSMIDSCRRDAYFQLIEYPVYASDAMNRKVLYTQKANLYARYNLPVAKEYSHLSSEAYNEIVSLTHKYNKLMSEGKWDNMMNMHPRDLPIFDPPQITDSGSVKNNAHSLVWVEGDSIPLQTSTVSKQLELTDGYESFISLFNYNDKGVEWSVKQKPDWLSVEEVDLKVGHERKLVLNTNSSSDYLTGKFILSVDGALFEFECQRQKSATASKRENKKHIAWNASDYDSSASTQVISGLGLSNKALKLLKEGEAVYKVYTVSAGESLLRVASIPNHPATQGADIRMQITIDDNMPQVISIKEVVRSEEWKENVLRNQSLKSLKINLSKSGEHTIRIKALDDGLILDQLMLDFIVDRQFYQIPVLN